MDKIIRVLFVCTGNICRSPMAEAVFRHMVNTAGLSGHIDVESAGTGSWHTGERPHSGTLKILQQHQIAVGGKRARQFSRSDLQSFDYVIAMDAENVADIQALFGKRVPRLLDYAPASSAAAAAAAEEASATRDVPDPYYNGRFDSVYDLVQAGCQGLLDEIRHKEAL